MSNSLRGARALVCALAVSSAACSNNDPIWVNTVTHLPVVGSLQAAVTPASVSVPQGGSASFTLTLTPAGGFTGLVQFAPIGSQPGVTFSPASATLSGAAPLTIPMTVSAAGTSTADARPVTLAASAVTQSAEALFTLAVTAVTPSAPVAAPTSLSLVVGTGGSVAVSEANYTGAFTESDTCAGIASVAQTSAGLFSVAPIAAGSCTVNVTDSFLQTLSIPVAVTAN